MSETAQPPTPTFSMGDDVVVADDFNMPVHNGMRGTISGISYWQGKYLYRVDATNDGRPMRGGSGEEKKVLAWKIGNWRSLTAKSLRPAKLRPDLIYTPEKN